MKLQNTSDIKFIEREYRDLFEAFPAPLLIADLNTFKIKKINSAALSVYQYTEEEFLKLNLKEIRPAEDVSYFLEQIKKTDQEFKKVPTYVRHKKKDGSIFFAEVTRHTINFQGEPALLILIKDITEELFKEKSLRESQEKFRFIAENIPQLFWIRSLNWKEFIYISPAFEKIWGLPIADLHRDHGIWEKSIHIEDRATVLQALNLCFQIIDNNLPEDFHIEYRIVRPDGRIRWIRDFAFPVRDQFGLIYQIGGIAEDITVNREMESKLRVATQMEAIGRLAGGVAHDFNNLLTGILVSCELLEKSAQKKLSIESDIDEIKLAANRAAHLTKQLLAFSRQQVFELRVFCLNDVIIEMINLLRRIVGEDIEILIDLAQNLGNIKADFHQIEQVIMNLLVNARDAMPNGGTVTIKTSTHEINGAHYADLYIIDTGKGMSPHTLEHLFEPFFTTKEKGKGTGLGLATVYGIVIQSGGKIEVESQLNKGSKFSIYFPIVNEAISIIDSRPSENSQLTGTETILIAEDDDVLRRLTHRVLTDAGYKVYSAKNGVEALNLCRKYSDSINLLITDVIMPIMNGYELVRKVAHEFPNLKIVYVSGYPEDNEVLNSALNKGIPLLPKPFTREALLKKVRKNLNLKKNVTKVNVSDVIQSPHTDQALKEILPM